jgi:RNA polymerase sigma factor (sigma-70 family)
MSSGPLASVVQHLRRLADAGEGGPGDAELLEQFIVHRDAAAFEALVRRHERLVLGVCRRVLRNAQDAEDAFQASFLILARKAASIGRRAALAGWLHRVALRVALRLRAQAAERKAQPLPEADPPAAAVPDPATAAAWRELRPLLDQEVNGLPARYHRPVVLCYLEGRSYDEAARQLGCSRGTVATRLHRARALLRRRLERRGLVLTAGLVSVLLAGEAATAAAAPAPLVKATAAAAVALAAGTPAAGLVSVRIATLVQGVLRAMLLSKLKTVTALALGALFLGGIGSAGVQLARARAGAPAAERQPAQAQAKPPEKSRAAEPRRETNPAKAEAPPAAAPAAPLRTALEVRDRLARLVDFNGVDDPQTHLQEVLDELGKRYDLKFDVNEPAFRDDGVDDILGLLPAQQHPLPALKQVPLQTVLRKVLGRLPSYATYVVRGGLVEITTEQRLHHEFWPKDHRGPYFPLVTAAFVKRPLREALQELATKNDCSIVLDERVGDKQEAPVTATLVNAPADTAAQALADAAGLRVVVRGTVLYVTTADAAAKR